MIDSAIEFYMLLAGGGSGKSNCLFGPMVLGTRLISDGEGQHVKCVNDVSPALMCE